MEGGERVRSLATLGHTRRFCLKSIRRRDGLIFGVCSGRSAKDRILNVSFCSGRAAFTFSSTTSNMLEKVEIPSGCCRGSATIARRSRPGKILEAAGEFFKEQPIGYGLSQIGRLSTRCAVKTSGTKPLVHDLAGELPALSTERFDLPLGSDACRHARPSRLTGGHNQ